MIFFDIDEIGSLEQFYILPNPVKRALNVSFELSEPEHLKISLFDASGQLVTVIADQLFPSGPARISDVPDVRNGTYILRITDGKGIASRKVIFAN